MLWLLALPHAAAAPIPSADEPPLWTVALVARVNPPTPEPPTAPEHVEPVKPKPAPVGGLMARIEECESRGDPNARNPNSTAKGLYQFLDGSWRHYGIEYWGTLEGRSVFDPDDNRELAAYVIAKYGTSPWNSSKHCWGLST